MKKVKNNGNGFIRTGIFAALIIAATIPVFTSPASGASTQTAVIATVAADYSSGAHSVASVDPVGGPRTITNNVQPTISDISICSHGKYFYRFERYERDNVTKFAVDAPSVPLWQFSTLDSPDDGSSNPQQIVFAGETKGYLFRMGSAKAWIVNPSTTTQSGFKTGELDLSAYADSDGLPEMYSGLIVKDKLFVPMRRQNRNDGWALTNTTYVAVFDTATDQEIDTATDDPDNMKGFSLPVKNPGAMVYLAETNLIYIVGQGRYSSAWAGTPAEYSGGVVTVDPDTYEVNMLIDDDTSGDGTALYGGNFAGMALASATKGYLSIYAGWGDNTIRTFNPSTGVVGDSLEGLRNKNFSGMDAGVYLDKNGMLWVCNQTDARIDILNPQTDTVDESISTNLNPLMVAFCDTVDQGYLITSDLWIRTVIVTEEKGEIEGRWEKSGESVTAAGDRVIYGHFYASPADVTWGSQANPDLFVKIWFDHSGRLDVNFFHVSVPDIKVYSAYKYTGSADEEGTATLSKRYVRHYYQNGQSFSEQQ